MGIAKFVGEYVDEMTEPIGWPDIDESVLHQRAIELLNLRNKVSEVLLQWRRHRAEVFDGEIWTGAGASAGSISVEERVSEITRLIEHLGKGHAYYNMAAGLVVQAKNTINQNLQAAQEMFAAIRSTAGLDAEAKEELVRGYAISQYAVNASVLLGISSQLSAFNAWTPSNSSIPPAAPTVSSVAPQTPSLPVPVTTNVGVTSQPPVGATTPASYLNSRTPEPVTNATEAPRVLPQTEPPGTSAAPGGGPAVGDSNSNPSSASPASPQVSSAHGGMGGSGSSSLSTSPTSSSSTNGTGSSRAAPQASATGSGPSSVGRLSG